jgi:hypothetical protein
LSLSTQSLNSAASNSAWPDKKAELLNSLLPINHVLQSENEWDEKAITRRSEALLDRGLKLWSRAH